MMLVILSILVITAYTTAVCLKTNGIPNSISATFYKIEHPYWFLASMWLTAGLLMPAVLEVSKENTEWVAFLACFGMILVGAAPNFKNSFEGKLHMTGAVMCVLFSQVWVALHNPWSLLIWFLWLFGTSYYMTHHQSDSVISDFLRAKPMFWVEIAALVSTYSSVLILNI